MTPPPVQRAPRTLRGRAVRALLYQSLALLAAAVAVWWISGNVADNLRGRGIQSGFEFLSQVAGFGIGETLIEFDSSHTYARAYVVGIANTLRVAIPGIVLATLLGTMIGLGRLSRNFLIRQLCAAYVEMFRDVPLLVHLFMWYFVLTALLPTSDVALQPITGVFLSQNGLQFPVPAGAIAYAWILFGLAAGCAIAWCYALWAGRRRQRPGMVTPLFTPMLLMIAGGTMAGWIAAGASHALDIPAAGPFSITGGGALTPEYMTLLIALVLYTAAYLAEIVRAGVLAVPFGQCEAARALGLNRAAEIRLVILPQALRTVVPPATSQYLNLTKNSSLAVAIGYPDLVSISNTILNQTGRALECIAIIMMVYLTLSLIVAAIMNWYNHRIAIRQG